MRECEKCHGTGYVIVKNGYPRFVRKRCPECDGRGIVFEAFVDRMH
jgi:DnaJ-class molecular chaperone